ncbi:MAG: hypothetical protein F6K54_05575 [Okeania sp. SIO3B5]|uniref:hypothetical protein n=1 Tax=Okeania sp. SIO3B5 TaxID=2607811 RepID=UPI0013FF7F1C|nr:hypothetical protein [Okeania sp. SIO3B5]NEO52589.1 hypothetical protein [Okeania sp. SIO3B5]
MASTQLAGYTTPGQFTQASEQIQGRIRTNNLAILQEKYKQSANLLTAEQIKTRASRVKITQANLLYTKEMYTAQKLGNQAQKEAIDANTAAIGVRTAQVHNLKAQIELGAAQVETQLFGRQKQAQIEGKQLDLVDLLSQNAEKSSLLALQGRLSGGKLSGK